MTERELLEQMVTRFFLAGGGHVRAGADEDNTYSISVQGSQEGSFRLTFDAEGNLIETMGTDLR